MYKNRYNNHTIDAYKGKYFCDLNYVKEHMEEYSTDYIEFAKGALDMEHFVVWREDSTYIRGKLFDAFGFNQLFRSVLSKFDFYDNTLVTKVDWERLYQESRKGNQKVRDAFDELKIWVDDCFLNHETFVIIGE